MLHKGPQVLDLPLLAIESKIYTPDWPLKEKYAPLPREQFEVLHKGQFRVDLPCWPISEEYIPLTGRCWKNMQPCSGSNLRCYKRGE